MQPQTPSLFLSPSSRRDPPPRGGGLGQGEGGHTELAPLLLRKGRTDSRIVTPRVPRPKSKKSPEPPVGDDDDDERSKNLPRWSRVFVLSAIPAILSAVGTIAGGFANIPEDTSKQLQRAASGALLIVYTKEVFDGSHTDTWSTAIVTLLSTLAGGALLVITSEGSDSLIQPAEGETTTSEHWPLILPYVFGFLVDGLVIAFATRGSRKSMGGVHGVVTVQGVLFAIALSLDNVLEGVALADDTKKYAGDQWWIFAFVFGLAVIVGAAIGRAARMAHQPMLNAFLVSVFNIALADAALELSDGGGFTWAALIGFVVTWGLLIVGDWYEEQGRKTGTFE
jgi:zinc transporter ZupT